MAVFTGTDGDDTANTNSGVITGFTGGTVTELQDGIGDTFYGYGGSDNIRAGSGDDIIEGGQGDDFLRGENGDDTFIYRAGSEIGADVINGGSGTDTITVAFSNIADFRTATIASSGVNSIERLVMSGNGLTEVRFGQSQTTSNGLSLNLAVVGSSGINILSFYDTSSLNLSGFTFTDWSALSDSVVLYGTSGLDTVTGTRVRDVFFLGDEDDTINAGDGNDDIHSGLGADTSRGGAGNDSFFYSSSADITGDTIDGGADADLILITFAGTADFSGATIQSTGTTSIEALVIAEASQVVFNGSQVGVNGLAGNLTVVGAAGTQSVVFNNSSNLDLSGFVFSAWDITEFDRIYLNGTAGHDILVGTSVNDVFFLNGAGGGDDQASGGDGGDAFYGTAGADTLRGDAGQDNFLYTQASQLLGDSIHGGTGNDQILLIFAGIGDISALSISSIEDLTFIGAGNHEVIISAAQIGVGLRTALNIAGVASSQNTVSIIGASNLNLTAFTFADWNADDLVRVTGTAGNDTIIGSTVADVINGGAGGDFIIGGLGGDTMDGGADFDTASWFGSVAGVTVNLTNQTLNAGVALGDTLANFENYYLTDSVDSFTNNANGGYIYGFGGVDTLIGGNGVEIIDGGTGGDTLNGGGGFDYVSWNSSSIGVTVNLNNQTLNAGGAAGDRVSNFEAYFLSEQADNFTGVTSGASIVFGYGGDDVLVDGTNSNAWLFGGIGNDTLYGGSFNDLLSGEGGNDRYGYNSWIGEGFDSILNFTSGSDKFQMTGSGFGIAAGTALGASNFIASASPFATSANPTFLYSTTFGILYFDPDGTGGLDPVALAQISGAPILLATDFLFI